MTKRCTGVRRSAVPTHLAHRQCAHDRAAKSCSPADDFGIGRTLAKLLDLFPLGKDWIEMSDDAILTARGQRLAIRRKDRKRRLHGVCVQDDRRGLNGLELAYVIRAFVRDSGDRHRADPFIGHFLREYSSHFPDRQDMFESVTARAPYYMALNLLRIARNDYIDRDYGERLVSQAKRLLRAA